MKIVWESMDLTGRTGLRADVGEYDSYPPVAHFLMDAAPAQFSPERVAVASALLFGPYASGEFDVPLACSPTTASAIARYVDPGVCTVQPVELAPRALPVGSGITLAISDKHKGRMSPNRWDGIRHGTLRCIQSDHQAGALVGTTEILVATNGWLLDRADDLGHNRSVIATAVLFAESLRTDTVVVTDANPQGASFLAAQRLLASCRLGLATDQTFEHPYGRDHEALIER